MIRQKSPPVALISAGVMDRLRVVAICLVLAMMSFFVFGQTAGFEFINYDDNKFVYDNPTVARGLSFKGFVWVFTHADCFLYHPLTMLSLMADYQIYGLRAGGYHLTNVLLHTGSGVLLFLVLRQMTGALWRSAFVAAVFAIHPLRVESVAWVAERKDVLSMFFFILTLGAYVHYVRKSSAARYVMVLISFVFALLSKPTVVTLPFVLLLLDYWPLRRVESARKLLMEKVPLMALAAAASATTMLVLDRLIVPAEQLSLPARLGNALVYYAVYLRQTFWPAGLALPYPYPANGFPVWEMILAAAFLGGLSFAAWRQRRARPWLLVGWLWYLGMFVPMIGIKPLGAFAQADRFTYLPQIGIIIAVTWFVAELRISKLALGILMAGFLAALVVTSREQTAHWQNSETLWTHTLACIPNNGLATSNLGSDLLRKGKVDDAIAFYKKAWQAEPDDADSQNNFGLALLQQGKTDEAISHIQRSLALNPANASAHLNLGSAFRRQGNLNDAVTQFQAALQIDPDNVQAQNNLAWLLATSPDASLRDGKKAVELAEQANRLTGGENPVILRTLAAALAEAGRFSEAAETAQQALQLAGAQSNMRLAEQIQSEVPLYRQGKPFHGASPVR